jgi:hypothetical protein
LLSEDELQELLRLALGPVLAGKQEVYHLKNLIVGAMPSIADDQKLERILMGVVPVGNSILLATDIESGDAPDARCL